MTRKILFDNASGHAVGWIWTNHSLSVEDAVSILDGQIINDANDSEKGNVIMPSGRRYNYEDLEIK